MNPTDLSGCEWLHLHLSHERAGPAEKLDRTVPSREKIRLRFINGSAMTYFRYPYPGLEMTVVAADGQYVNPVTVDEFRIAVAETYDVIVEPQGRGLYHLRTIHGQDRLRSRDTGHERGLSPAFPRSPSSVDHGRYGYGGMGHDMAGIDHGQMGGMDNGER